MRSLKLFCLLLLIIAPFSSSFAVCTSDSTTLCLLGDRFQLQVNWRDQAGNAFTVPNLNQSGAGQAQPLFDDTGLFSFFAPDNPEILVKVLNGCSFNDRFWVFAAAPTNMEYTLTVTDTADGAVKTYTNPFGVPAAIITDTAAFATCAAPLATNSNPAEATTLETKVIEAGTCVADASTLCMQNNRFSIQVDWEDFNANTGAATPVALSDQSGYFWFFSANNAELLIKVLDGVDVNDHAWVYFAATSNVRYTVTVTDTLTKQVRIYTNPLGNTSTVLDNQAFRLREAPPAQPIPTLHPIAIGLMAMILLIANRRYRRSRV